MSTSQTILIIDDDNRNIFALSAMLKSKGLKVLSSTSAQDGIALLRSNSAINIVLMDMMMPEMDGYEAIGIIRGDEAIAKTPVIAVTAQAMVGDREKTLQAGADDYISKPVDVDQLLKLIETYQ